MGSATAAEIRRSCCSTWQHPAARLLLGDHLHPGGRALTEAALEATLAGPGDVVLDIGCGHGASLDVMRDRGIRGLGIDLSADAVGRASGGSPVLVGDGERIPLADGSVDGAIVECVLSLLLDKSRAVGEIERVLKPGSPVALSDVVVAGPLPTDLEGVAAWSCCIGGAVSRQNYADLITGSGLEIVAIDDHPADLIATIDQVRRRLSLLEMSVAMGGLRLTDLGASDDALERARNIAAALTQEVREGTMSYVSIVALKPGGTRA